MRKRAVVAGAILLVLLAIQLIRPERNQGPGGGGEDMLVYLEAPAEVSELLRASCYDCHSDQTHYPWYGKLAPMSWLLNKHIVEGKEAVNFSEFKGEGKAGQIRALSEICEVLEAGIMPLKSYLLLHGEAALDEDESTFLCDWADLESMKILKAGK